MKKHKALLILLSSLCLSPIAFAKCYPGLDCPEDLPNANNTPEPVKPQPKPQPEPTQQTQQPEPEPYLNVEPTPEPEPKGKYKKQTEVGTGYKKYKKEQTTVRTPSTNNVDSFWDNFSWSELTDEEKRLWHILGWNENNWSSDREKDAPISDSTEWDKLNPEEQDALIQLGYTREIWNSGK